MYRVPFDNHTSIEHPPFTDDFHIETPFISDFQLTCLIPRGCNIELWLNTIALSSFPFVFPCVQVFVAYTCLYKYDMSELECAEMNQIKNG